MLVCVVAIFSVKVQIYLFIYLLTDVYYTVLY